MAAVTRQDIRRDKTGLAWSHKGAWYQMSREIELPLRCVGIGYHTITKLDGLRLKLCGLAKFHAGGWVLTELGADVLGEIRRDARNRGGVGGAPGDQDDPLSE
jgi:hypothetical protein